MEIFFRLYHANVSPRIETNLLIYWSIAGILQVFYIKQRSNNSTFSYHWRFVSMKSEEPKSMKPSLLFNISYYNIIKSIFC